MGWDETRGRLQAGSCEQGGLQRGGAWPGGLHLAALHWQRLPRFGQRCAIHLQVAGLHRGVQRHESVCGRFCMTWLLRKHAWQGTKGSSRLRTVIYLGQLPAWQSVRCQTVFSDTDAYTRKEADRWLAWPLYSRSMMLHCFSLIARERRMCPLLTSTCRRTGRP